MTSAAQQPLLRVSGLSKSFGALQVARSLNVEIFRGERVALIGPNGAGKTTFVNLLTGVHKPSAGTIELEGRSIGNFAQHHRVAVGLGRTFQISSLFKNMTVFENVYLALAERHGVGTQLFSRVWNKKELCTEALNILDGLGIADHASWLVSELSYGRQRLIELAIAIALQPKLLLLDEPAAGIPATDTDVILKGVESLSDEMAILIIDHDMDLVFRFAERIIVLVDGAIFRIGTPSEIAADPDVKRLYLGE